MAGTAEARDEEEARCDNERLQESCLAEQEGHLQGEAQAHSRRALNAWRDLKKKKNKRIKWEDSLYLID